MQTSQSEHIVCKCRFFVLASMWYDRKYCDTLYNQRYVFHDHIETNENSLKYVPSGFIDDA